VAEWSSNNWDIRQLDLESLEQELKISAGDTIRVVVTAGYLNF